jgi:hypothetical protein
MEAIRKLSDEIGRIIWMTSVQIIEDEAVENKCSIDY